MSGINSTVGLVIKRDPELLLLGRALRNLREGRDLSQERLADLAKLHRTFVGSVERGERNASFLSLMKLTEALKVSWTELGKELDRVFR
jgi:transcriptional regulator with XRE-family HTH domain